MVCLCDASDLICAWRWHSLSQNMRFLYRPMSSRWPELKRFLDMLAPQSLHVFSGSGFLAPIQTSVQFTGNPIMPSTHKGQGARLKSIDKPICFPKRTRRWTDGIKTLPRSRLSDASGVGKNPDAVSAVRSTNAGSWYAMPFDIKPDLDQRPENLSRPSIKQLWAVLHDDVLGS
jgi:hypothetical protein